MGYTLYVDWLKKEIQVTDREYGMCPEEEELNRMAAADPDPARGARRCPAGCPSTDGFPGGRSLRGER